MTIDDALFTGEVHPVAALFPMMTDDELDDLAADIKANGLIHPIVLDAEGRLIDGRNRLAACQRGGVDPSYSLLNGHDPVAFILSVNVARRHLSKGQAAMAVAKAHFLVAKNCDGAKGVAARSVGVSAGLVSKAVAVMTFASELSDVVMAGGSLDEAYEEARRRKVDAECQLKASTELTRRIAELQRQAPDLAELVANGQLETDEAEAALAERKRKEDQQVRAISDNLGTGLQSLDPGNGDPQNAAEQWAKADPRYLGTKSDFSAARARRVAAALLCYADLKERNDG